MLYRFFILGLTLFSIGCGAQLQPPKVSPGLVESERQRQKEHVLRTYFERAEQVSRVSDMLRTKGAELCEDNLEPVLGIYWADKKMVPEEYWDASERVFGVGDDLRVLSVVPGLPASQAGIRPGDIILAIDGTDVTSGFRLYSQTTKADQKIAPQPLACTAGAEMTVAVPPSAVVSVRLERGK